MTLIKPFTLCSLDFIYSIVFFFNKMITISIDPFFEPNVCFRCLLFQLKNKLTAKLNFKLFYLGDNFKQKKISFSKYCQSI